MEDNQTNSIDPLKVFWDAKWRLLVFTLMVAGTTYTLSSFLPNIYQAKATVLSIAPTLSSSEEKIDSLSMNTYRDLALTAGFLQSVIDRFKSENPKLNTELYPEILANMIEIESSTGASLKNQTPSALITFKVTGDNPKIATKLANALITLLAEESRNLRKMEIATIYEVTNAQYISTKETLLKLEQNLATKKARNNAKSALARFETLQSIIKDYESRLMSVNLYLVQEESILALLNDQEPLTRLGEIKLFDAKTSLRSLRARQSFLKKSLNKLTKEIKELQGLNSPIMLELSEKQQEREIKFFKKRLDLLSEKLQKTKILKNEKTSDIRFVSNAVEPRIPIGPNRIKFILVSIALSLAVGFLFAIAKEHLSNTK